MGSTPANTTPSKDPKLVRSYLLLFLLFFLICSGLGYATLNRYRPSSVPGLSDSAVYYQLVAGSSPSQLGRPYMRCRVLVPFVARPFYQLAQRFVPSVDPIAFGLLVANAFFCAVSACLLVAIGDSLGLMPAVRILAATLYLLSFAVTNLQLAGLVDSGEACFMLAIIWSLITQRAWCLPIFAILGTLAKETFVPLSIVLTITWVVMDRRQNHVSRITSIALLSVSAVATLIVLHSVVAGQLVWPWQIAAQAHGEAAFLPALLRTITDRGFWYVFIWLLPVGLLGLKHVDRRWVAASAATAVVVLLLGAWKDMAGTVARPLFNTVGPMLALSSAIFLNNLFGGSGSSSQHLD